MDTLWIWDWLGHGSASGVGGGGGGGLLALIYYNVKHLENIATVKTYLYRLMWVYTTDTHRHSHTQGERDVHAHAHTQSQRDVHAHTHMHIHYTYMHTRCCSHHNIHSKLLEMYI